MPATVNLTAYRGDTFTHVFEFRVQPDPQVPAEPRDLTGYTVAAQLRSGHDTAAQVDFAVDVDGAGGEVTVSLTAVQTATPAGGYYDVQATAADGTVETLVAGYLKIDRDVTR